MNILYVEDSITDSDLLLRHFSALGGGFSLTHVKNITDAIEQLQKSSEGEFDIVLTDFQLPDGTGLELLNHIRSKNLPLAVVMITSQGDEQTAVIALKSGADDYVPKSFDYLDALPSILFDVFGRTREAPSFRKSKLRVLYAEHLSSDIDLTKRHLAANAPYIEIKVVNDAIQLLSELRKQPVDFWDVLLMDYQLPGMNALEALREINHLGKHPPVIIVTGQGDEQVATQALRLGAVDYIVKHPGYLHELAPSFENAYHWAKLQSEHEALKESEQRYQRLVNNARDVIYRYRVFPTLSVEFLNPAVFEFLGYTPDELYSDPSLSSGVIHPEDKELINAILNGTYDYQNPLQLRWIAKDGSIVWIEQQITPIFNSERILVAIEGIARDITLRRQAEQTIHDYNERLEEEVEARTSELKTVHEQMIQQDRLANLGRLAGGMAHELRNPLGVISNAVYYLRMILPDANEKVKEYLGILEKESQSAVQIMSDLLNFSTFQTGDRYPTKVKDLLDKVLRSYPPVGSIEVQVKVADGCEDVFVDSHQIELAIGRIVANAYQAMDKGGTLKISVKTPAKAKGDSVSIVLEDTGTGISQEDLGKVFEPLFTTKPRHIGLGLPISKRLIEVNGGTIALESKWGKGTQVTVTLPIKAEG